MEAAFVRYHAGQALTHEREGDISQLCEDADSLAGVLSVAGYEDPKRLALLVADGYLADSSKGRQELHGYLEKLAKPF